MRSLLFHLLAVVTLVGIIGCGSADEPAPPAADSNGSKSIDTSKNMSDIGLAFHNFHDRFQQFPAYDQSQSPDIPEGSGLSWRVHMLVYLDHVQLYRQFKLDEPWDSPHNKKLIDKMPDFFKTPGVKEKNTTAIHVFIGEGTPFVGKKGTKKSDFTDGIADTFLVVHAGADKAEIWTKPGGLPFDNKLTIEALGNIGDHFLALFANGSVKEISKDIKPETLRNLIQHQDGNILKEY